MLVQTNEEFNNIVFFFKLLLAVLPQDTRSPEKLRGIMKNLLEEQRHETELRPELLLINLLEVHHTPILVPGVCLLAEMVLLYTMKANGFVCA